MVEKRLEKQTKIEPEDLVKRSPDGRHLLVYREGHLYVTRESIGQINRENPDVHLDYRSPFSRRESRLESFLPYKKLKDFLGN